MLPPYFAENRFIGALYGYNHTLAVNARLRLKILRTRAASQPAPRAASQLAPRAACSLSSFPPRPRWSIWEPCVLRYSHHRPLSVSAQAALSPPHRFVRHIQLLFYFITLNSLCQAFFAFFFAEFLSICAKSRKISR